MTQEYDGTQDLNDYEVVKFYADWCGPCKTYAPIFDKLAELDDDKSYISINVDEFPATVRDYNVKAVPTVVIDGEKEANYMAWSQSRLQTVL